MCRPVITVSGPRFPPQILPLFLSQQLIPGHRDRLEARSLQFGPVACPLTKVVNSISLHLLLWSFHNVLVTAVVKEAQESFPAVSSNSKGILCHACRHHQVLPLFTSGDVSDRANSVYRERRLSRFAPRGSFSLISDVATVDFSLLNLLPTSSSIFLYIRPLLRGF